MFDKTDFDADFLALQILQALDAGLADDHVVAVGIIREHDHDAFGAATAHDEVIAIGDEIGINLSGENAGVPWLSEGFATYSDILYTEHLETPSVVRYSDNN